MTDADCTTGREPRSVAASSDGIFCSIPTEQWADGIR